MVPIFSSALSLLSINFLSLSVTLFSILFISIVTSTLTPFLNALISSSVKTLLIISLFEPSMVVSGVSSFFTTSTLMLTSALIIGIIVTSVLFPHTLQ